MLLTFLIPLLLENPELSPQIVTEPDSIRTNTTQGLTQEDIEELKRPVRTEDLKLPDEELKMESLSGLKPELNREELLTLPNATELPNSLVLRKEDWQETYPLPAWESGYVYGSNYTQASMLYGYIAAANAGIRHRFGEQWRLQAEVGLQKNSIYYNTASMSGKLTWQPSPYFALTAFGAYSPGSFMSPVQIGPSFQWGGYVTLQTDTNIPFGIDLGARQTYDAMFGHEMVPIVQPFVKINGMKMGIDLGPMLKEATRKKNGGGNGFNPIPQPVKALPPVAPRR